jgi:hypothetical protein
VSVDAEYARMDAASWDLERARQSETHDDRVAWPAWQQAATSAWLSTHPDDRWLLRPPAGHRPTVDEIARRGERLRSAKHGVWPTWRIDPDSPKRSRAEAQVGFFHEQMAGLYGPIFEAIAAIQSTGQVEDVETLVRFLEADIYCDSSGYVTVKVINALRRTTLSLPIAARLRHVILTAVDGYDRREFRVFCRLAKSVRDDWLVDQLSLRLASNQSRTARHARWVLDAIDTAERKTSERN